MRILVTVKAAASLDEDFELVDDVSVDPDCVEWELNEWDACALEEAVRIGEASEEGVEVIVLTVGGEASEEALRSCLAVGADRAIRVWNDALGAGDPLLVAAVLAAVARRESPDLILAGVQSSDSANGATGIAMAGHLGLPHAAVVKGLDWDHQAAVATIERELEGGVIESLRLSTPAVLTIQTGANEPRYANLRAVKRAREKPLDVLDPAALDLDPAALDAAAGARLVALREPEATGRAEMLDGDAAEIAARILELVESRRQG